MIRFPTYHNLKALFSFLVSPKSKDKDLVRREFILNILLLGSIFLSFIADIRTWVDEILATPVEKIRYLATPLGVSVIFLFFLIGYFISRAGKSQLIAYLLIAIYLIGATYTGYMWGIDIPQALLTYSLIIVMSGILISSRFAFIIATIVVLILFSLINLQERGIVSTTSFWRNKPADLKDAVIYSITFFVIAIVSWLFNREMEKALKRARNSEAALRRERDQLEVKVEKRTQELRQTQVEKLGQLYRFAEFGRLSSGLFHDLANPLNLVSLNLNQLNKKRRSIQSKDISSAKVLLDRAIIGTKRLESFVDAARKQMQNQEALKNFSIVGEINQAIQMLSHRSKEANVKISFLYENDIKIYGNPIKFSQLMTNLISNAIDAYSGVYRKRKLIEIIFQKVKRNVQLIVRDSGSGIDKKNLPKIFDPLFTTKSYEKGTGIGLSICKDVVEKDFKGTIQVESKKSVGTTFTILFPIKKVPKT